MEDFEEIQKKFASTPVRVCMPDLEGSGVLRLRGQQTSATIATSKWITNRDPSTGWFDVVLDRNDGSKILLHNAVTTSSIRHGREAVETNIFPNIVVLNAENLLPDSRVREIKFTAEGLEDFFHYEIAEWQSVYRAPPEIMKSLRRLRDLERHYPRQYEYFRPSSVYLVHDLPRVFRVRVDSRTYEMFLGRSESHGNKSLAISARAIATIRFDKPVSIDSALDAAWAWHRFFVQMAMEPLPFLSFTCRARLTRKDFGSTLYLPNLKRETPSSGRHMIEFGPHAVPYGQWRHRAKFAQVMRRWLELDAKRRLFRVRLDRVLDRMRHKSSTRLVADLCAAIESLSELGQAAEFAKKDIDAISAAASAAAASSDPPIPKDRIVGVLSLLRHQSLPQRLKRLTDSVGPLTKADRSALTKSVLRLRTFEMHGSSWDEMTVPMVQPTLDLLSSVCVLWDLTTSGMPVKFDDRTLTAAGRTIYAARDLLRLSRETSISDKANDD